MAGQLAEGLEIAETALARLPAEDPSLGADFTGYSPFLGLLDAKAWALERLGRLEEASEICARGEQLARQYGDFEVLTWLQLPRIEMDVSFGDAPAAAEHARSASESAEKSGTPQTLMPALFIVGIAHRLSGRWDDAVAALEEALRAVDSGVNKMFDGWVRAELSRALLGRGDLDRAEQEAQIGATSSQAQGSRCDEIRARIALAHTQFLRGDPPSLERAEQALRRSQELIEETGARAYQPEVHECRAQLARLRGDAAAAEREIEEARRLYAEMGATVQVERLSQL
jgi:ATP/maltotriose-dependent transcriptional regulator MalT